MRGNNEKCESFLGAAAADTLELRDGRVLKGKYLGGTQAVLRFEINGEVQTFNTTDAVALTFTGNAGRSAPAAALAPAAVPSNSMAGSASGGDVTIPAGQSLLVRMIDGVDSAKNHVGDVFHGSLETDVTVGNTIVARKGTDVYGRLANAEKSGTFTGKSELQLELTRMVIDGKDYPVVSSDYRAKAPLPPRKWLASARPERSSEPSRAAERVPQLAPRPEGPQARESRS